MVQSQELALIKTRTKPMEIRDETTADIVAIRDVNRRAFAQEQEGNIVVT